MSTRAVFARVFMALGLALASVSAIGATFIVGIGDDCTTVEGAGSTICFGPTPLTIQPGDSVTFYIYNSYYFHGPHNVAADDGSFRCAKGCDGEGGDGSPRGQGGFGHVNLDLQWSFTRTFDTPGVVAYHDEVSHASGVIVVREAGAVAHVQAAVEYVSGFRKGDIVSSYFVTSSPDEIIALDAGAFGGSWQRTGETFSVWSLPTSGALPACRFVDRAMAMHFYTPYAAECSGLQKEEGWQQGWQFEGIAFYLEVPDGNGNCPLGTTILYRLYNASKFGLYPDTRTDAPLHRLTTSAAMFNEMRGLGWEFEGDGRTFAFACVPTL